MEIYIVFGVVTAVMLGITFVFFYYKNWLPLKKNRAYIAMLMALLIAVIVDVLLGCAIRYWSWDKEFVERLSRLGMSICTLWFFFFLCLYDFAMVGKVRLVRTVWFRICMGVLIGASVLLTVGPVQGNERLYHVKEHVYVPELHFVQVAMLFLFLGMGGVQLIRQKKVLLRREYRMMIAAHGVLVFDILMQNVIRARNLTSYLTLAEVLIFYYILLHNQDQYLSLTSQCFNRSGFQKVLTEKAKYNEDFSCLGICINNIESITNSCDETEIRGLLQRLGWILKSTCGRHNVYQIHSFEYMVLVQNVLEAERMHTQLMEKIPSYFRIHDKNVALVCGFYTVNFFDAVYDQTNFNRIISSMRKLAMNQTERGDLLHYGGENQKKIQEDLDEMQRVSQCIAQRSFDLNHGVIQSLDERETAEELILCKHTDVDEMISQERIWKIATDTGCLREVGYIMMELACEEILRQDKLQKSRGKVHINLTSGQIANEVLAQKYITILKNYGIARDRICIEVTFDLTVNYEGLLRGLAVFKENGIRLLLDQFGVTVCNLKDVLNMPFDCVKVNNYMVLTFCEGNSHQLTYLIRMLNNKNWKIYLDGVDNLAQVDVLHGMPIYAVQGMAVTRQTAQQIASLMKRTSEQEEKQEGRYVNA